jgi:hypothetical protein
MHHAENGQAGRSPEMHVEPVVLDILDSKGLRTLFRAGTAVIHGASVALANAVANMLVQRNATAYWTFRPLWSVVYGGCGHASVGRLVASFI